MELTDLKAWLDTARRRGARGAEMSSTTMRGVSMARDGGAIVDRVATSSEELCLRVWLEGGKVGVAVGHPSTASDVLDRALAAAASAPADPFGGPVDRLRPVLGGLGIADRRYASVTDADRAEVLELAEHAARAEAPEIITSGFRYADHTSTRRFANSRGVAHEEVATTFEAGGQLRWGEVVLSDSVASRSFSSVASLPFGTSLARRAAALSVDGEVVSGEVCAMLPPRVVAALFGALGEAFVEARLSGREPFFLAPQGGRPVVDTKLHLLDDGHVAGGLRTRAFDDRGVVPVPLTLLREGVPEGCLRGPEAARAAGGFPTGHSRGDALQCSNLILRAGGRSMSATWSDFGGVSVAVDDLDTRGLDLATGALHATIDVVVMRGNQPIGAMRRRPSRWDLRRMLGAVKEVCSDTDRIGHVDAPGLFVDGLVIDGSGAV